MGHYRHRPQGMVGAVTLVHDSVRLPDGQVKRVFVEKPAYEFTLELEIASTNNRVSVTLCCEPRGA